MSEDDPSGSRKPSMRRYGQQLAERVRLFTSAPDCAIPNSTSKDVSSMLPCWQQSAARSAGLGIEISAAWAVKGARQIATEKAKHESQLSGTRSELEDGPAENLRRKVSARHSANSKTHLPNLGLADTHASTFASLPMDSVISSKRKSNPENSESQSSLQPLGMKGLTTRPVWHRIRPSNAAGAKAGHP